MSVWDVIYREQRLRWGLFPSLCAHLAAGSIARRFPVGSSIIDIGAGYGRDVSFLSRILGEEYEISAIDSSVEAVRLWAEIFPQPSVSFVNASIASHARTVRESFEHFDVVVSNYVLHLLPRSECITAVETIRAMLKPNGVFIFSLVNVTDARRRCAVINLPAFVLKGGAHFVQRLSSARSRSAAF